MDKRCGGREGRMEGEREENQQRKKVRKDEMMKADLWLLAKR